MYAIVLALKVQLLGDLVNANGHTAFYFTTDVPRTAPCAATRTIGDPDFECDPSMGSVGLGGSTTGGATGQFAPNRFQNRLGIRADSFHSLQILDTDLLDHIL